LVGTCQSGSLGLASQLVDAVACTVISGASISGVGTDGIPYPLASATSGANGTFYLCSPEGNAVTIEAIAGGYPTTYIAEVDPIFVQGIVQVPLISTDTINTVTPLFPGRPYDQALGTLIVKTNTGNNCKQANAGWTVTLSFPDGGSLPDGGYEFVYGDATGIPDPTVTETESGFVYFYNIDPTLGDFFRISYENADAGFCQPQNDTVGITGRVYVAGNAMSFFPILLP